MATVFTHAFLGAALARIGSPGVPKRRLAIAAAACAALPDVDVAAFALGIPYEHPLGHRGATHSLAFAAALGALVATWLVPRPRGRSWFATAALLACATASHGLLDAMTDAGLGVGFFLPFDDARFFAPWRPLSTSPIATSASGVAAFFAGPALRILANEFVVIWLPTLALLGLGGFARRRA